jgi:mRNA-degrading endonuclease toxin of MazEF toxin-antitoxin module
VDFPKPRPSLVIRYSYLWRAEKAEGREEGIKDRPCAVILVLRSQDNRERVVVLPITHAPPRDPDFALEIPAETKARIGLDADRSWIMLSEINRFTWPGPDLRPTVNGDLQSIVYGMLPEHLIKKLRDRVLDILRRGRLSIVERSE